MNILKQIKKKYRNFGIFKGLFLGCLLAYVVTITLFAAQISNFKIIGTIAGIITALLVMFLWIFRWNQKYKKIEDKVMTLESSNSPLDYDNLQLVGRNLSLGKNWLVYHNKLNFDFWTKNTISKVRKLSGKNIEITDNEGKRKSLKLDTSRNIDEIINDWLRPVNEFDFGSNSANMINEDSLSSIEGGLKDE